jgi:hypothetical protein
MSVRPRPWQAVALAGGVAVLLTSAVVLTHRRSSLEPTGRRVAVGRSQAAPAPATRLLVARGDPGARSWSAWTCAPAPGAPCTVHLPELRPGRRRLAELVPLVGGAVAGVVADDAEWSPASTTFPPEPGVYAWPSSDFDRPGRLLGRASEVYPSPAPGRLWLSTASVRGGVTTFTVRELDAVTGRQASPPRSLGPYRWVQGFVTGGRALTTELLPLGARRGPGWVELLDARTGRPVRRLGPVGATMATAQGSLVGYNAGCSRRPALGRYGAGGPEWVVECAALGVVNVETGQRWRSVDGRGWTIPMPLSPDGRWLSYVRRPHPSGPVELYVTGADGRPVRLLRAARFSQAWPNNRFTGWGGAGGVVMAAYQGQPGAPWRLAGWRMDPAGPARLPLRLDDLLADAGRPGAYLRTVTALAVA